MKLPWHDRPGLAGGIDKDGRRAAELLGLGFGSVEFGTAEPGAGLADLLRRLAALPPRSAGATAIGIGLGLPPATPAAELPAIWQAGLEQAWALADYLSFNLSARDRRPLLAAEHLPLLGGAFANLAAARARLPRRLALAVKLPLGSGDTPLPAQAEAAATAGFDAVTVVLPESEERWRRLAALARRLEGGPAVVAVGGIRCAADVAAARAAGASAVQVHRLFAEYGADCLAVLRGPAA